jgi:hypothetical protein
MTEGDSRIGLRAWRRGKREIPLPRFSASAGRVGLC